MCGVCGACRLYKQRTRANCIPPGLCRDQIKGCAIMYLCTPIDRREGKKSSMLTRIRISGHGTPALTDRHFRLMFRIRYHDRCGLRFCCERNRTADEIDNRRRNRSVKLGHRLSRGDNFPESSARRQFSHSEISCEAKISSKDSGRRKKACRMSPPVIYGLPQLLTRQTT